MEVATCLGVLCGAAGRPFVTKHAAIFAHEYRIMFLLPIIVSFFNIKFYYIYITILHAIYIYNLD